MLDAHSGLAQASALDLSQNGVGHFGIPRQHARLNHVSILMMGRLWGFVGVDILQTSTQMAQNMHLSWVHCLSSLLPSESSHFASKLGEETSLMRPLPKLTNVLATTQSKGTSLRNLLLSFQSPGQYLLWRLG